MPTQKLPQRDRPAINRRELLGRGAAAAAALAAWPRTTSARPSSLVQAAAASAELVHHEIFRRFLDPHNVLLDFTGLDGSVDLPTRDECLAGRPNALGWWTPTENGAMFGGMYLDGLVERWKRTRLPEEARNVHALVNGLLSLSECSSLPGFIGRGFADDGRTTWPMGSNDQTAPWFYGLWKGLQTDLFEGAARQAIVDRMRTVAEVLVGTNWLMPAEEPFRFRGGFNQFTWEGAPRLLFVCKALHQLTGEAVWDQRYQEALQAAGGDGSTRRQICRRGMTFDDSNRHTWTGASSGICLRGLWELEHDPDIQHDFFLGLQATARLAAEGLQQRHDFVKLADRTFELDWRVMNPLWVEQKTPREAVDLALRQLREINRRSPRRRAELGPARESIFAAWVVTLCPDPETINTHREDVLATIAHYRADEHYCASFFPLEAACYRLLTFP